VLVQLGTEERYRGRVYSVVMLTITGLIPLGGFTVGSLGSLIGVDRALMLGGGLLALLGVFVALRVDAVRGLRGTVREAAPV